jgi:mono/diheme cytochrome c family protein
MRFISSVLPPRLWAALGLLPLGMALTAARAAVTPQLAPAQVEFFENKIRPIFANHCMECHSAEKGKTKGGLSMDSREELLKGGESGPGLKPKDVKGSTLIKAVTWEDDLQMPPKKKLSAEQIEDLKKWVAMGAPDPREPSKTAAKNDKKAHWAFQPIPKVTPPTPKNAAWCNNAIDKFVLAKLEEKGMLPAPQADKEALLRRVFYDLIGIPPSPLQIEQFVRDPNPDEAYARVIDQLLASPAYGERWGRHWLDTARYSDTTGDTTNQADRITDYKYPYAWTYREWVINAVNKDLPYDQFLMQQLAADKLPDNPKENLAALGLLTVGQRFAQKDDIINDRIDVIGRGLLGLTVACARCHDHKFDPVTAADYYALRGIFLSSSEPKEGPLIAGDPNSPGFLKFQQEVSQMEQKAYAAFYKLQREYSDKFRKNAANAFTAAMLTRASATPEEMKEGNELQTKFKLETFNGRVIGNNRLRPFDDVYGPFVKLVSTEANREAVLSAMLAGRDKTPYNPEVIAFLKAQKSLPSDLKSVAELVGKLFDQMEPRVAAHYNAFTDPAKDIANSPDKAAMELAVFPLRLVPAAELSLERLIEEGNKMPTTTLRGQLEKTGGIAQINNFKTTFKGGPVRAMVMEDLPQAQDSPLYVRGNAPKKGDQVRTVPRRFLEVLSEGGKPQPFKLGSGRLELAQSIASKGNPLTARVMVNRVWMHHFGEGLVRTPDDLGNQAGKPSHPELLDFLSNWFMEDFGAAKPGWSVKALHKAIMLSKIYRQSSNTAFKGGAAAYEKTDPANTLLWRANVRRLDFEAFRDSLISMGGLMDNSLGGHSFNVTQEPYIFRRSIYAYIDRADMPDLLMQFDMSNPDQPNSRRTSTIVPQQALFLMNSSFVAKIVQSIVKRPEIIQGVRDGTDRGINAVYRVVLQRLPTPSEKARAIKFLVAETGFQATVKAGASDMNKAAAKTAERNLKTSMAANTARSAIVNEGELVERVAFSPWETLVQSLLFSNEAAYVN